MLGPSLRIKKNLEYPPWGRKKTVRSLSPRPGTLTFKVLEKLF